MVAAYRVPYFGRGCPVTIVGDEQRVGSAKIAAHLVGKTTERGAVGRDLGFTIDAHHLLTIRMSLAGENAGLRYGCEAAQAHDAAVGDVLLPEALQQQMASFVVADHSDRKYVHPERGEIVDCVAPAAGNNGAIAVLENKHGCFAGYARNFT